MAEEKYKFAHLDLINQNPSHVPRVQEYYIINLILYILDYFYFALLYLKFIFSSTIYSIANSGWSQIIRTNIIFQIIRNQYITLNPCICSYARYN